MGQQQDTPALDFLRRVQIWQEAPGGTAGIAVELADRETATLEGLLEQAQRPGAQLRWLDVQARQWLVGYREMTPPLSPAQAAELNAVIDRTAGYDVPGPPPWRQPHPLRRLLVLVLSVIAVGLVVTIGALTVAAITSPGSPAPAARPVPPAAAAPAQQLPPAATQLQQFEADWGVPAAAQAAPGNPGTLVLLMNGLYYPTGWAVPSRDPAWGPDTGGHVAAILTPDVTADRITFTDGDGASWTVGTGQPFVLASDPGTVLEFGPAGNVLSMPEDHAVTIRHRA